MAPTTEQEVDAMTDAAMRALLKEQIAAGTAGRGEEKNTVLFKQEPPYLEEYEDYAMWKVKFTVWQAGTAMSDQQQACCVIQGLRDDHKHHKKGLQSLLLKTLTEEEQKKPTITKVLKFLDEQLGEPPRRSCLRPTSPSSGVRSNLVRSTKTSWSGSRAPCRA